VIALPFESVLLLPSSCTAKPFNNTLWPAPALATGAKFTSFSGDPQTAPPNTLHSLPPPQAANTGSNPHKTNQRTFFIMNALSSSGYWHAG
jgi:hypothetical protein